MSQCLENSGPTRPQRAGATVSHPRRRKVASKGQVSARERAGGRYGTEVSRVPGGPQTGWAGEPALHGEPGRADLSSEGGASGGDPKDGHGLAATLPEVESKPCHYAGPAQPGSGEERPAP